MLLSIQPSMNRALSGTARGEQRQITLSVKGFNSFLPDFLLPFGP